jgi:glycine/D-amino acid oxidase-like deaminating enzyme
MKTQAQIVVIGGGIFGAQVAYHLAKYDRNDVVIVEKGEIASGESSHAAGLVTQFATSQAMLKFRMYSVELYSELGLFDHVGSLRIASSPEQLKELERSVSRAKALGLDCEVISPDECLKHMPQISRENLFGGVYLPRDGQLDPYITTTSMVNFAKELGVEVLHKHARDGDQDVSEGGGRGGGDRQGRDPMRDHHQRGRDVGAARRRHGGTQHPDHAGRPSTHRLARRAGT